jgi:tetratricopeptide (TPR) repeat protein
MFRGRLHETHVTEARASPYIMWPMVIKWLKAQDAADAGAALADSFPHHQSTGEFIRQFLQEATQELRSRKLNFYRRVRFANAFRWRLLEKGVAVETAHDITQTLLINISALGPAAQAPAVVTDTSSTGARIPYNRKSLDALLRQADECAARGAYVEAVALYREFTAGRPKDAAGFNNLGATLIRLGRYEEARKQLHTALALSPRNAEALFNIGNLRLIVGRYADAENSFKRAAGLQPTDPLIRTHLGEALLSQRQLDKARTEFQKALKTNPRFAPALAGLGTVERLAGRFAEAEQTYRRALEIDPALPAALVGLALSRRMNKADSGWIADAEKVAANTPSPPEEANLRFAIGKALDDLGQYAQAFNNYKRANALLKPLARPFDVRERSRFVNDMITVYTPETIRDAKAGGSSTTRPVFVVGMPRSGTSLLEQILASHPSVAGVGELDFWSDEFRSDEARIRKELLPQEERQKIAADYLSLLKSLEPDAGYVVNKTPANADHLGLIHSVFPNARIIYARRDPIDTCLSCYFQNFSMSLNFKFDLNDLAGYYLQHERLMAHWRKVLPAGTLLDVPYEDLVRDQESWTRKILAHLGLEWDVRCLKFNENPRPVVTASSWQVRQGMYSDSVKRWRNYSKFIEPLRKLQRA